MEDSEGPPKPITLPPRSSLMHATPASTGLVKALHAIVFATVFTTGPVLATDPSEPDAADIEFFEQKVRPLLVEHCYECHSSDDARGGLALDHRDGLLQGGDSGAAIIPGDPNRSLLIDAVLYKNLELQMPPKKAMSADDVRTLEQWIQQGAADPRVAESSASPKPTGMSIEDGSRFWSFLPLSNPEIPSVRDDAWIKNPIDAFVLSQLDDAKLHPAPAADKRTLIRRISFNLIGLPPTPEEVSAFLLDDSPNAYSKLVDRLLESPHYGERWGRHWLDVARYADSNGLDENVAHGNAWRYRDYVVDAFNQDKPLDQFLIEQIAGDLLPEANQETKTATGFLTLGAKVLAERDQEKVEMDIIDEQLDTIGKAFLGMTIGCVRCHDHKFDPLKQTDYYALAAIFKSTQTSKSAGGITKWHEHSFADADEQERMKVIEKEIASKHAITRKFTSDAMALIRNEARIKAADYLVAATKCTPQMSLIEVASVAESFGLHPRILHHCRLHLQFHTDDPFFAPWHALAGSGNAAELDRHYRGLFEEVEAATEAASKQGKPLTKLDDPRLEMARAALHDPSGFLAIPSKPEFAFDDTTLNKYRALADEARIFESNSPDATAAMGVRDREILTSLPIHIRGSHRNLGTPVRREFPAVMRRSDMPTLFPRHQSGRLELARWMASPTHPLTARVYVNRIWRWHFGSGIVASTENFGILGERPTHPEMLDWLAHYFMESGWSTKQLHRLIANSNTYQMSTQGTSSSSDSDANQADPENKLLSRFPQQRLDAEQIRDSVLAVTGRLDVTLGGKTLPLRNRQYVFDHTSIDHTRYESIRRAIYLPVIRNNLYTMFEQFDFPDPTMPTGNRSSTIVAPQALLMMNSDLVIESADALALRLLASEKNPTRRVQLAYEHVLGRPASDQDIERTLMFIGQTTSFEQAANSASQSIIDEPQAWSLFCQSLLACNEFFYLR